jgi:transcriptional regulator with XRE-family HTH domain
MLDTLLQELKAQGITQTAFAESIGMNPRHLSAIKSSELRNRFFNELGATKLACLWVIEKFQPVAPRRSKV